MSNFLTPTAVLNRGLRIHDWYLIPESYSEPLIVDAFTKYGIREKDVVLDPFSGAGTTCVTV
jgi:hypothetical protein